MVEVLDNPREHIMDGVVFETPDGVRRFVDAPEVARTAELGVTLTIPRPRPPPWRRPRPAPARWQRRRCKRLFGGLRRR